MNDEDFSLAVGVGRPGHPPSSLLICSGTQLIILAASGGWRAVGSEE